MSIKNYLIHDAKCKDDSKESSNQTSSKNVNSQGQNPTFRSLGQEAPEDSFEEDTTRLKTQKITK